MKKDSKRLAAASAVGYFAMKTDIGKRIINKRQGCHSDLPDTKTVSIFYDRNQIQEAASVTDDLTVTEWNVEIMNSEGDVVGHLVGTTKSTTVNDKYIFDERYNFVMEDSFISVMSAYKQNDDTFTTNLKEIDFNILDSNTKNKITKFNINYENDVREIMITYE
ncbi:hypothetical protein CPAV1605_208 [seawater metagenome]|uniref:Uncharacterized protein n=1 Tax=seawater metagenome TaxID=1561972 RepID=A0A5E8CHG1_9ZZZZ